MNMTGLAATHIPPDTSLGQAQKAMNAAIDALHLDVANLRERLRPALLERAVSESATGGLQAPKQPHSEVITTIERQHAQLEQLHQSMQALLRDIDL